MTAGAPLAALANKAIRWSALTTAARFVLQLGAQVALARLLGPGNFGVYGLGIAVLTFAAFLCGSGFSQNLMLQERITREDIRFSFTWQLIAGAALSLAILLGAPALAAFFADARLEPVLHWIALACLLSAAAAPATCLLQRELNFRAIGLVQLAAYACGYLAVGLPLALAGWDAQALAVACVVQNAVALVGLYWARPHPLRPLLRHAGGAQALGTGRTVFVTNVVNWLLSNLDRVIIGRVLGAHAVGLYTVAWNLAQIPSSLLTGALQPAFLATGARLAGQRERLAQAWLVVLACVLVLLPPAAVVLALLAHDLVALLYGPAWAETGWLLALMLLCLPAWAAWGLSTPVLWNTGRKHLESLLQLPLLALLLPAWWLLAPLGLRWAAAAAAAAIVLRAVVIVHAGLRALDMRWRQLAPLAARGLALAALAGGVTAAAQALAAELPWAAGSPLAALVPLAAGALAAAALAGVLLLAAPQLLGALARLAVARMLPFVRGPRPVEAMP